MTIFEMVRDDTGLVRLPSGAVLYEEGDTSEGVMYVLTSGTAIVIRNGVEIRTLDLGDLVGETSAICSSTRLTTIVAKTACSFARIDHERFLQMIEKSPEVSLEAMRAMAKQFLCFNTFATKASKLQG